MCSQVSISKIAMKNGPVFSVDWGLEDMNFAMVNEVAVLYCRVISSDKKHCLIISLH